MNKIQTCTEHIDPALKTAGWGVVEGSRIRRDYLIAPGRIDIMGRAGRGFVVDYVLEYRNTRLAVSVALAWSQDLAEGVAQAKHHAAKLGVRYAYSTNGRGIHGIDLQTGHEAPLSAYPTPQDLWALTFEPNVWRERFAEVDYVEASEAQPARYYQDIAVERVLQAIATDQQRILLTLAGDTGEMLIAFRIAWKLYQARWNLSREPTRRPRILVLSASDVLVDETYAAFSGLGAEALVRINAAELQSPGEAPKSGSVYFATLQTFKSDRPKKGRRSHRFGEYPPDFFDFLIVDQRHRGGADDADDWRGIVEYFSPAVQLCLTAPPAGDAYAYFGEPVYEYSLEEAIDDGFINPP